jgi:adenylate cyclase
VDVLGPDGEASISPHRTVGIGVVFLVAAVAVAITVLIGFFAFVNQSRRSILAASERVRESAAHRVESQVSTSLGDADRAVSDIERLLRSSAVSITDPRNLEVALYGELSATPRLAEVTVTAAPFLGYDAQGEATIGAEDRFQLSELRSADGTSLGRSVRRDGDRFVARTRTHSEGAPFADAPWSEPVTATDPTTHATFTTLATERNRDKAIWSDLHYSELDAGRPNPRVVLSLQKAVSVNRFLAVIRVALLTTDLDAIARAHMDDRTGTDPHRIALLAVSSSGDGVARLVARVGPNDHVEAFGDDLRFVPVNPAPEIAALIHSPLVRGLDMEHPNASGVLPVDGKPYLATLRELSRASGGISGWLVAILVPEAFYTADLARFERMFLVVFAATLGVVLAIAGVTLIVIRRGLAAVTATTSAMRRFDFAARPTRSSLREIDDVMLGLERAKTVVRAMGKYIPLDLVRRLYDANEEPLLGGELADIALLFTDIEGFTTLSEKLAPDQLAGRLGDYLEAMTTAIARTSGTIDKYIGDAVMAFWNAPTPVPGFAARACEAVLECKRATAALYASAEWRGLPALTTRYGLHRATVMVGHFGARSRISYTALGDGVNLAARLEPLCKQYDVTVLVSEAIVAEAEDAFVFRRVDRVAVKGKSKGIDVYELLGRKGEDIPNRNVAARYEQAFQDYLDLAFERALALLEGQLDDGPSRVLAGRCREYCERPPSPDWNRVHVARSK